MSTDNSVPARCDRVESAPIVRRQLSLYVPHAVRAGVEAVRSVVDPIQQQLIPAHVTLCREHELSDLSATELRHRLHADGCLPLRLSFGPPERFDGHGMLLPGIDGEQDFHALRDQILGGEASRDQRAHITLAHPRNPRAAGNALANTSELPAPLTIRFDVVRLIEQIDRNPWTVLDTFELSESSLATLPAPSQRSARHDEYG